MRLVIEIDDAALRSAVEAQVGKAVAELAAAEIQKQAQDIILKKFERLSVYNIVRDAAGDEIRDSIGGVIAEILGDRWGRKEKIEGLIKEAAKEIIRGVGK